MYIVLFPFYFEQMKEYDLYFTNIKQYKIHLLQMINHLQRVPTAPFEYKCVVGWMRLLLTIAATSALEHIKEFLILRAICERYMQNKWHHSISFDAGIFVTCDFVCIKLCISLPIQQPVRHCRYAIYVVSIKVCNLCQHPLIIRC